MSKSNGASSSLLKIAVVISIFGLAIVPVLLQQSNKPLTDVAFSRLLVGSLYTVLCILGISAVFYPRKCEESFIVRTQSKTSKNTLGEPVSKAVPLQGHHPDCEEFSANRVYLRQYVLCAACTGLLAGATVSLTGALLYFFIGIEFIPADSRILLIGYAGLFAGLAQFKFHGYAKMIANLSFVLGSLITLIIADSQGRSFLIDLYVFGLIVFLLLTRILISEWNNSRTCVKCETCRLI